MFNIESALLKLHNGYWILRLNSNKLSSFFGPNYCLALEIQRNTPHDFFQDWK